MRYGLPSAKLYDSGQVGKGKRGNLANCMEDDAAREVGA